MIEDTTTAAREEIALLRSLEDIDRALLRFEVERKDTLDELNDRRKELERRRRSILGRLSDHRQGIRALPFEAADGA